MATKNSSSTTLLDLAENIAEIYHEGQIDKRGRPYIKHLENVVLLLVPDTEIAYATGFLHDILEDTNADDKTLIGMGIPQEVVDNVRHLTHKSDESYIHYIDRIKQVGGIPLKVKIADIKEHLLDISCISDSLVERYKKALCVLVE